MATKNTELVVENVTVTLNSVMGWSYLQEEPVMPPMGGWPENFPTGPQVTGTPKTIYDVAIAMDGCEEVQHRALWVKGERVGWCRVAQDYYNMEALYKVAKGKRKGWDIELYRVMEIDG